MTTDYRPIACDRYSELEVLALRRQVVRALVCDADPGGRSVEGRVVDLRTRDGAEYLILQVAGDGELAVRLDRVRALFDGNGAGIWRREFDGSESDRVSL